MVYFMDIEELRAKCILLGCTWSHVARNPERPWFGTPLSEKNGWHGRKTEREVLEDLLKYKGAYDERTV